SYRFHLMQYTGRIENDSSLGRLHRDARAGRVVEHQLPAIVARGIRQKERSRDIGPDLALGSAQKRGISMLTVERAVFIDVEAGVDQALAKQPLAQEVARQNLGGDLPHVLVGDSGIG